MPQFPQKDKKDSNIPIHFNWSHEWRMCEFWFKYSVQFGQVIWKTFSMQPIKSLHVRKCKHWLFHGRAPFTNVCKCMWRKKTQSSLSIWLSKDNEKKNEWSNKKSSRFNDTEIKIVSMRKLSRLKQSVLFVPTPKRWIIFQKFFYNLKFSQIPHTRHFFMHPILVFFSFIYLSF